MELFASGEESDRSKLDMVQLLAKVRVRHHQVDQPAVLGTRSTWHAQRACVSWAQGALGLRLCSVLDHLDPSERTTVSPASTNVDGTIHAIRLRRVTSNRPGHDVLDTLRQLVRSAQSTAR